jgi:hypothetical protein
VSDDDLHLWLRPYGATSSFIIFLQEFAVARDLATSGDLAQVRLALIAADHLADVVLHSHARRRFAASERSAMQLRKRFDATERDRTLGVFNRKVNLAEQRSEDPPWLAVERTVGPDDGAIMRIAHRYRNPLYHEDRHNPVLLIPLTWLYLGAVGRAFVAQQPLGYRQSFPSGVHADALRQLGYSGSDDGLLDFRDAAETIITTFSEPIEVPLERVRETLALDVEVRMSDAASVVRHLLNDGMPFERLTFVIRWSQTWRSHGADPAAQTLQYRRDHLSQEAAGEPDEERRAALLDESAQANEQMVARWHEIQRTYEPPASLDTMVHMRGAADRVRATRRVRPLLETYEKLDREISAFEFAVGEAADAWERIIENAIDAARES